MKLYLICFLISLFNLTTVYSQSDEEQIKGILKLYQQANEKLDTTGTAKLFSDDSKIFESGGRDRKSTRLNSSHSRRSRMPSSA